MSAILATRALGAAASGHVFTPWAKRATLRTDVQRLQISAAATAFRRHRIS
jgi:hypothetical protein